MANVKAISLSGITHNTTKIGVQDGQAEDIVNLRFKDGSWRPVGKGEVILDGLEGCSQLYIHTNVYRHLLGVKDGKLWWFASASEETPEDFAFITPVCLADVTGEITIVQTGHLISVVSKDTYFKHFVFHLDSKEYIEVDMDANGAQDSRSLYPFGDVHFNHSPFPKLEGTLARNSHVYKNVEKLSGKVKEERDANLPTLEFAHDKMRLAFGEVTKKNKFTRPFLACAAIELYDGSYAFATNPVLVFPREQASLNEKFRLTDGTDWVPQNKETFSVCYVMGGSHGINGVVEINELSMPVYANGVMYDKDKYTTYLRYSDLSMSIGDSEIIKRNKDVFSAVCIFVTPEVDIFNMSEDGYKDSKSYNENDEEHKVQSIGSSTGGTSHDHMEYDYFSYAPARRNLSDIAYDLSHSCFYLLKRYNSTTIDDLIDNPIIDLSKKEDEGLLANIVQQDPLPIEAHDRKVYVPSFAYNYNGRLHISNYKSFQYHGFPIDVFNRHNHAVSYSKGSSFLGLTNLMKASNDDYVQFPKETTTIYSKEELAAVGAPLFFISVLIKTGEGEKKVCRYVKAGENISEEDLNPIISFPDSRATKMEMCYVTNNGDQMNPKFMIKRKEFKLTPHPYLNLASYISDDLKPIKLSSFTQVDESTPIFEAVSNS